MVQNQQQSVLVVMTNGDVYHITPAMAVLLEKEVAEQSTVLFRVTDVKLQKVLRLQPMSVSSIVGEADHA